MEDDGDVLDCHPWKRAEPSSPDKLRVRKYGDPHAELVEA
jgi:hypothetical protein